MLTAKRPVSPPGDGRRAAHRRRHARPPGSGHRRARRAPAPPARRRPDVESRASTPSRGARCCSCSPVRPRTCAPMAASGTCGRRPAVRASRSRRSTTPKCFARSRGSRPAPSRSSPRRSPGGPLDLDESGMRLLLDIVQDPARLQEMMAEIDRSTEQHGATAQVAAFMTLLKGLAEYLSKTEPRAARRVVRPHGARGRPVVRRSDAEAARAAQPPGSDGRLDQRCRARSWNG